MNDSIQLRFIYTEEEYVRAAGMYQVKRGGIVRTYTLYFVLIVAIFLALAWYQGFLDDLSIIWAPILLTAIGFGSMFFTLPRSWKKAFRADPRNSQPFSWEINAQGVTITSGSTQAHFDWGYFRETLEAELYFFLIGVQIKNQFYVIPKRAFESAEQMECFRAIVEKYSRMERIG